MKRIIFSVVVALICHLPLRLHAAGIPVVDSAAIAQDAANFAKQMLEMANQLNTLKSQLDQQVKQYTSLIGDRGMGQLLDGQMRNYLPNDWNMTLSLLDNPSGYGNLSSNMKGIIDRNKILSDSTLDKKTSRTKELISERRRMVAMQQALSDETYKKASERIGLLQQLVNKIGSATDPKAIMDLQARIQSEQTHLQNESIKIQALSQELQNLERTYKLKEMERSADSAGTVRGKTMSIEVY